MTISRTEVLSERDQTLARLYERGATVPALAQGFGLRPFSVYTVLHRQNAKMRPRGTYPRGKAGAPSDTRARDVRDRELAAQFQAGATVAELASKFSLKESTVGAALRRMGVRRKRGRPFGMKPTPAMRASRHRTGRTGPKLVDPVARLERDMQIVRDYLQSELTLDAIGKKYDLTREGVRLVLRRQQIPQRKPVTARS